MMNKLPVILLAVTAGVILLIVAFTYFALPANSLPTFLPGHQVGLMKHHYKHGIGTLLLGFACFVFAWFQSGKKIS